MADLRAAIAKGEFAPVYLLWGEDAAAMTAVVRELREALFGPNAPGAGLEAFNHERFDAPYVKAVNEVLSACAQLPTAAPRRLVELSAPEDFHKHVQGESTKDKSLDALMAYFDAPNPSCTLVITSAGLKGTSKLVKAAKKASGVVEAKFGALSEEDAVAALRREAQERGWRLDPRAAQALAALVGTQQAELVSALERAAAHAGDPTQQVIGVENVEAVVVDTREADIFALTDAVGQRDHRAALAHLATMFRHGERDPGQAMRVFSMLVWQMRRLCAAKFADDPVAALGIKPFAAQKLQRQADRFDPAALSRAYAALGRLDAGLKGGSRLAYLSPYIALQRWILEACGALEGVAETP